MMLVEINRWRATIGCFRVSMQNLSRLSRNVRPLSILFQILKLYWFCYWFIAVSILVLPFSPTVQFLAVHSIAPELCFLPLFARIHRSAKIVLYVSLETFKRIPLGVIVIVRYKFLYSRYIFFYTACVACCSLQMQWLVFRVILLSGDVETNPGPATLNFCTWNLSSITAHDFLRVSLIEAYNSVHNYDLIGIVETHLDSTVEEDRLALNGYTFIKITILKM